MSNKINVTASIDRPSKVYHPNTNRHCEHTSCKIRLSKYNPTNYCSTHERYSLPATKFI
jgi:hypothetical protein